MAANDSPKPLVYVLMGSPNDRDKMEGVGKVLAEFGVAWKMVVASAHRTPDFTVETIRQAETAGAQVFICAAGYAAHLAGVVAAHTLRPVIGVPLDGSPLSGLDALYSTVMMPGGIPVATVTVGKAGATNAALLAVQILSLQDPSLVEKLREYRAKMREKIYRANE
jgi:5-(carboxyamino)imidazole ribonucleotide mutase